MADRSLLSGPLARAEQSVEANLSLKLMIVLHSRVEMHTYRFRFVGSA
jgi:hypothetical protein